MTFLIICNYILVMLVLYGTFMLLQKVLTDGDEDGILLFYMFLCIELIGLGFVFYTGMKELIK